MVISQVKDVLLLLQEKKTFKTLPIPTQCQALTRTFSMKKQSKVTEYTKTLPGCEYKMKQIKKNNFSITKIAFKSSNYAKKNN